MITRYSVSGVLVSSDQYVEDFKAAHEGKKPGCTGTKGYGTPGSPKILDKDGDGTISSDDRVLYNQGS